MNLHPFGRNLQQENYARNTVTTYEYAVRDFFGRFPEMSRVNLFRYKDYLIENYKPKTVNVRIQGINKFLDMEGRPSLKLKTIKMPKNSFLENVISDDEYTYLKKRLRKESDLRWYFIVWTLGATGARVSELVQIQVEHMQMGYFDVCSKGGRIRRLYFPDKLQSETLRWLEAEGRTTGSLFLNSRGEAITPRGISLRLKEFAEKYGINPAVVHPHSFRHLFAKNFLSKSDDIALLADLLGHDAIETTRIYLQRSSREQQVYIDRLVDW
ncbi:MAG: tyrosine-type recombinase/integrase [Bacteroidales bacterium]|nr:tyrosine-type recombinase/integrase [Bacteroidales bacterium]